MKKLFAFLLTVVPLFVSGQMLNNNKLLFSQRGLDVTPDGKEVYATLGDSKIAYNNNNGTVPTPIVGTAFQWDNSSAVIALTNTDLVNSGFSGTNIGSPWPQFAISNFTNRHRKTVIADGHVFGSYWYNATGSISWNIPNTTLYNTFKTRVNSTLSVLGLQRVKGIYITLGVNDAGSATAIDSTTTSMTRLVNKLNTDFNTPNIYISITGLDNNTPTQRMMSIRNALFDLGVTYSNVYIDLNENTLYSYGNPLTAAHWEQDFNNVAGRVRAAYLNNPGRYSNKYSRAVVYGMYDPVSTTKADAINTFIVSQTSAGNWPPDMFQVYVGDTEKNILMDWGLRTSPLKPTNAATFTANTDISTNGTNSYLRMYYMPSVMAKNATSTDIFYGLGTGAMNTAAGTAATAFGTTGGTATRLGQNASSQTNFNLQNSTPQTYTTDTKLQSNTDYVIWRTSSTNMELLKNNSIVSTKSVSGSGLSVLLFTLGCQQNNNPDTPTTGTFYDGHYYYFISSKQSTFNFTTFYSDWQTLKTALSTP